MRREPVVGESWEKKWPRGWRPPAGKTDILARMRFQPEKPLLMGLGTDRVVSMAVIGFIAPAAGKKPAVNGVACRQIERCRQNEKKI